MSKNGRRTVIGCAACAAVGMYGYFFFKADPRASSAAPPVVGDAFRIRYNALDGVFLVYDAAIPEDDPDQDPRFLAYWRDYNNEASYVFGRQLFTDKDMGYAMLGLTRDSMWTLMNSLTPTPACVALSNWPSLHPLIPLSG